ncbi:hypothetical protein GLT81_00365 [Nanohaloarchaea archaeon]|nr:hypothetical protein [Candidatus Nanohaloarchaea archaeon]
MYKNGNVNYRKLLAPLALLSGLLYFFRPWFHSVILSLYVNPFIFQIALIVGGSLVGYVLYYREDSTEEDEEMDDWQRVSISGGKLRAAATIFFVLFAAGGVLNTAFTNVVMAEEVQNDLTEIDKLPDIDNTNPRILPRTVASEFAENSLQEPRHKLGPSDIAIGGNGTPYWSHPLQPDGDINSFLIEQKGAAFADMTTSSANISYSEQKMDVGIGMQVFDNINWVLKKEKYWVNYEDHFVLEHKGENYIATPYIEYDFEFTFPIVHTVPEWGGVALTDSEGNVKYIEAEDVRNNEVLKDQRAYPFDLARGYVSAMEYREGIINKWFLHENQLEVAPVPGFNNEQPFMILTEDNPELFVATEPYGEASGLFEIWTIDAVKGRYEVYRLDRNQGLIGANRAVNFVKQANSRVNWADQDGETGFAPIEPLPVIVDDKLYWQVRIVPLDSAGIAFTSFVEAESSNVFSAQTDEEIVDFLEGEPINQTANLTTENSTTKEGDVKISIIENGEVIETVTTETRNFSIDVTRR